MDQPFDLLAHARGETPADLILRDASVVNVFTGEIERTDVAIANGLIVGVGPGYTGRGEIDLKGAFVAPGLIDAHVHIESSLCTPREFARAVVPRGITSIVADPHEIANVAGIAGVEFMADASRGLPLEVIVMAPSCVPATPMATSGGAIGLAELESLRDRNVVHGLAEVMNFPGVIGGDEHVHAKVRAMAGRPVDGHCPGVRGTQLNAYVASGVGSDHESVDLEEAREKLRRGLYLLIREATNARNLDALLPLVTPANSRRVCFCTDDRTPGDLLREGSIDMLVRRAIAAGVDPIAAIQMATLNPSEWFGLGHIGAIAPGRVANLIVFDDLRSPVPRMVFAKGELVARDGAMLPDIDWPDPIGAAHLGACNIDWNRFDLKVRATSPTMQVIGSRADQLVTDRLTMPAHVVEERAVADPHNDVLKMSVVERHRGTGRQGVAFIKGFGLKKGAIAGTIAHDHHNLVIIGADDASMLTAAREVARIGGGLAVADGKSVLTRLALPVGGLMSDRPIEEVAERYDQLIEAARVLGSPLADPFMAMSFMALEVIPSLKLTDQGLVDAERFERVGLFV